MSIEPHDHAERLGELAPLGDEPRPQFVPCREDCAPDPSKLRPPALPWEHCSP